MCNLYITRLLRWLFATLFIAMYSINARAEAPFDADADITERQAEVVERARIERERAASLALWEQQRKACYQKLAVTSCFNEARDIHNEKIRDLKRQEVALNDAQRKRAAADRLRLIDERNSPQAQLQLAERRGRALLESSQREQSQISKTASHQAKESRGRSRTQPHGDITAQRRADSSAKMEKHRLRTQRREKAAKKRQEQVMQREANRKKPAAASLPIPN
jgi:colicin import membrane protein